MLPTCTKCITGYCTPSWDHSILTISIGWVPENGYYWNSRFPLPQDNSYPSSPFHRCDWPNPLNPSYVTDTQSSTAALQHPPEPIHVSWRWRQCIPPEQSSLHGVKQNVIGLALIVSWSLHIYKILILFDNYHLSFPAAVLSQVWANGRQGYVNKIHQPTANSNW